VVVDKLIKETPWSRVYQRDDGARSIRSKFRTDGLSVASDELKRMWSQWNESERLEFAQAFSVKASFSHDDCRSLEFLVQDGSDFVASAVAIELANCRDSSVAFDLIFARLSNSKNCPRSNFFQALARLADQRGVAVLQQFHEALAVRIVDEPTAIEEIIDYLSCCTALAELTKDAVYKQCVETYLTDSREPIRFVAKAMIETRLTPL
jgi:hypothetical protein